MASDKELNEYLQGDTQLSKLYRETKTTEPSSRIDENILTAAEQAVAKKTYKPSWTVPVSLAAVVTLSVSLVLTMQDETGQSYLDEPKSEFYESATILELEETVLQDKKIEMGAADTTDDSHLLRKDEDSNLAPMNVPAENISEDSYRVNKNKLDVETSIQKVLPETQPSSGSFEAIQKGNVVLPERERKEVRAKKELEGQRQIITREQALKSEAVQSSAMSMADELSPLAAEVDSEISLEMKNELLKIKKIWEEGHPIDAKLRFDAFLKKNPEISKETMIPILGFHLLQELSNM